MSSSNSPAKYELMLAFIPTLTEKELEKELDTVKSLIMKLGEIFHEQIWGKRDLYYTLKGYEKGLYAVLHFTSSQEVASLNKELKLMNPLMRFLLLRLPANFEVKPFVVLEKEKEEKPMERPVPSRDMRPKRPAPVLREKEPEKAKAAEEKTVEEKPETEAKGKGKASFDEKIDSIIKNLDNL